MQRLYWTLLYILFVFQAQSQNLVPNPSFEQYKNLPCSWNTSTEDFNQYVSDWHIPSGTSTDILSTLVSTGCWSNASDSLNQAGCRIGFQLPHSGDVMAGIFTVVKTHTWHEYLQVQLKQALQPGQRYCVEMWISAADYTSCQSNNVGMYFSTDPVKGQEQILATPQINYTEVVTDVKGWTKVSGSFIADAAHEYLTIGNFFTDEQTLLSCPNPGGCNDGAYFFIDDIVVMACPI